MISLVSAPWRLTRVAAAVFGAGSSCRKNDQPDQPVNGARVRQRTEPGNLETIRFASTSVVKAASSSATGQAARKPAHEFSRVLSPDLFDFGEVSETCTPVRRGGPVFRPSIDYRHMDPE